MLWIKSKLEDFHIYERNIPIFCDNTTDICLSNHILHSRAKQIENKHHFSRDYVQKETLVLKLIDTNHQQDDIFKKPLTGEKFGFIVKHLKLELCPE